MTYRTRTVLFYILLVIFLVGGTGVVFYSQGWRIDFHTWTLEKVGALYLRTFPKDASLRLDGKPVKNGSGILSEGTLANSLFPKTYTLDVSAPGFVPWRQTLVVQPRQVTERKYLVLVPETHMPLAGTSSTQAFWLLPDTTLIRKTTTNALVAPQGSLPGTDVIAWSDNARYVITRSATKDYVLTDIRRMVSTPLPRTVRSKFSLRSNAVSFVVTNEGNALAYSSSTMALVDPISNTQDIPAAYATGTLAHVTYHAPTNTLAWTLDDPSPHTTQLLMATLMAPFHTTSIVLPAPVVQMAWTDDTHIAVLDARGSLLLYDTEANQLIEIAHSLRGLFAWSPVNDAVAVRGDGYIEIIPRSSTRDGLTIPLVDADRITSLVWFSDMHHLLAFYPDRVDLIETDPGAEQTIRTVFDNSNAVYDAQSDILYGLHAGALDTVPFPH
jgi:hypothetical protein